MKPTIPRKYCSIAFAVLWLGWMAWWRGIYQPANNIILSVCGVAAGYFWYLGMRWSFRRMGILPPDGAAPGADRSAS
jgi:hypothetical protein